MRLPSARACLISWVESFGQNALFRNGFGTTIVFDRTTNLTLEPEEEAK
jgi:hypothetical protein